MKVEKLKELYKFLSAEIVFLAKRIAKHVNKLRSKGLDLKEGGKVYLLRKNIKTRRDYIKLDFKKLGLFLINKKIRDNVYRLKLLRDITIYLVFHVSLLEPTLDNAKL